jgi:hypothetical protein
MNGELIGVWIGEVLSKSQRTACALAYLEQTRGLNILVTPIFALRLGRIVRFNFVAVSYCGREPVGCNFAVTKSFTEGNNTSTASRCASALGCPSKSLIQ